MNYIIAIYITNPNKKTAKSIGKYLLKHKLIACANIFPVESIFKWKDKIVEEKEFVLFGKTAESNYPKIVKKVEKIHPYKVPCVIKLSFECNQKFFGWLKSQLT